MSERTGISAVTPDGKKTKVLEDADKLFFDTTTLRNKAGSKDLLSDDEVQARCEAIALKLNFMGNVIESNKFDNTLVAFRDTNNQIADIAIPEGC